jgi:EAL domain-containing protein (putative c-di-GMP-specific phosphodiesterase class I)
MRDVVPPALASALPYLEHYPDPGGAPHHIVLDQFPFRIGRSPAANFVLYCRQVSKEHAAIVRDGAEFRIQDRGSCNGTYVNGRRVVEAVLQNGDIVHIAHKEFRFGLVPADASEDLVGLLTESATSHVPRSLIQDNDCLRDLLKQHLISIVFQPIVRLDTREVIGYEALGRGLHDELSSSPAELFRLAEQWRLAADLSRLFRMTALEEASHLSGQPRLFFNLHPAEMAQGNLLDALAEVPAIFREGRRLVLEVHENAVADPESMRLLRNTLKALDIGLAYDDFGAGQARLAELADVPPDFIKLDRKLVHGIDQTRGRQELVQALSRLSTDLGVALIAEGIESEAEAETCQLLGCQFGQGFLFGHPVPARQQPRTKPMDLTDLRQRLKSAPE